MNPFHKKFTLDGQQAQMSLSKFHSFPGFAPYPVLRQYHKGECSMAAANVVWTHEIPEGEDIQAHL
jgi:hypothetical protein